MKEVQIYTDGACRGNPGHGGWGTILVYGKHEKELSGGEAHTTNNRMELSGVIAALAALREPCEVTLTSDSSYVVNSVNNGWVENWRARGWRKADKSPALNVDLWEQLLGLLSKHRVTFKWVQGHAGHPYNERCDKLATAFADSFPKEEAGPSADGEQISMT
jgi:ribonuclease HI